MGKMRFVLVIGVIGTTLLAGATPAAAATGQALEVTSTGLSEGQVVGVRSWTHPTWTGGADITKIEIRANTAIRTYTSWPNGLRVPINPAWNDIDVLVTVRIFAADGATAEAATTVRADTSFPQATFTPPATPIPTIVHGVITVTAVTYSDDITSMTLYDYISGDPVETIDAAPWMFRWDTVNGPREAGVEITDRAGNITYHNLGLAVDNTVPQISEVGYYYYYGVPGRVHGETTMHVTFNDASGVNRTQWLVDGTQVCGFTFGPNSWGDGDLCGYDFGFTPRTVPVEIHAWDRGGNESVKSFSVTVDSEGPRIAAIGPARNMLVRGAQITSTVEATDPAGVSYGILNGQPRVDADGSTTLKDSVEAGQDGQKQLVWQVVDYLGNSTTARQLVTVDNTRPALSITAPKDGAKVSSTITIAATATDRNGINRVELLVDGKIVAKDSTAAYRLTLDPKKYGKTFRVAVRAYDQAGNATSVATRTWHR